MGGVKHTLGQVFKQFMDEYRQQYPLTAYQLKVVNDIMDCRTESMGGHWAACTNCGELTKHYNFPILGTGCAGIVIALLVRPSTRSVGYSNAHTTCSR